jgi:hypothetical protein
VVWLLSLACLVVEAEEPLRTDAMAAIASAGVPSEGDCTPIVLRIARTEEDRLRVEMIDGSGRTTEREVRSPEMLAALVESWAIVPSDLMEVPEPDPIEPRRVIEAPVAEVEAAPPPIEEKPSMFLLSALAEVAVGDDLAVVAGPALGACVRFGWFCIDVDARLLFGRTVGNATVIESERSELELSLGASAEWTLGPIVLAPGVSAGAAWLRFSPLGGARPILCPPDDPCVIGQDPPPLGSYDRARPRVHAMLAAYVPFNETFALEVAGGGTFSPLANDFDFIGEARWSGRFSVGLRTGL